MVTSTSTLPLMKYVGVVVEITQSSSTLSAAGMVGTVNDVFEKVSPVDCGARVTVTFVALPR